MAGKRPPRFEALMRGSGRDVVASRAVVAVVATGVRLTRILGDALATADLTPQKFLVLMELASTEGGVLPLSGLMSRAQRSAPNMSSLISRMERAGLVKKSRSRDNQRSVGVSITEAGWQNLARATPLVFSAEKDLVEGFTRKELKEMARLVSRF